VSETSLDRLQLRSSSYDEDKTLAAHHTNSNGASLAANPKMNRLQGIDGNLQSSPQSSTRLLM
jgi:hypothetical protein